MPKLLLLFLFVAVTVASPELIAQYTDGASGGSADGDAFDWNWLGLLGLLGLLPRKPVDERVEVVEHDRR